VLLSRYADLLKSWAIDERERDGEPRTAGVRVPERDLGEWERQSTDLRVSPDYRDRFDRFADHFESETTALGDDALSRELETLETLATYGSEPALYEGLAVGE